MMSPEPVQRARGPKPGCTVAAPSSSGGIPAAVTDGGDGVDTRRASSRPHGWRWPTAF